MKKTIVLMLAMIVALPALTGSAPAKTAGPKVEGSSATQVKDAKTRRVIKAKPREVTGTALVHPCSTVPNVAVEVFEDGRGKIASMSLTHFEQDLVEGVTIIQADRIKRNFIEEFGIPTVLASVGSVLRLRYSFGEGQEDRFAFNNPVGTVAHRLAFVDDRGVPNQLYHTASSTSEERIMYLDFIDKACGNAERFYIFPLKLVIRAQPVD